jgi:dTDP-4-amino-4,6-dideoxygalactose transaminase
MEKARNTPFVDLVTPHKELAHELTAVFHRALANAGFIGGAMLEEFERAFAAFCGTSDCVGVANGTDAVLFALITAGVRPGDAVVTTPHTFIGTTESITHAGALPEFVDIDERTYNIDPKALERYLEDGCVPDGSGRRISRRTGRPVTAIVPVHVYGQMADMDPILELGRRYGLIVMEDACQAHGAEYFSRAEGLWRKAGSMTRTAAFSFYPAKNLGACGEAGAVTTSDPEVAARLRMMRDHGQARKYLHAFEGYNSRLDAIQAGILHVKLPHLSRWNAERRERAAEYDRLFAGSKSVITPYEPEWSRSVHHLYVVRVASRDQLVAQLAREGIGTGLHYPVSLHLQEAYWSLGYRPGDLPVAERVAAQVVSLPMYPNLTADDQARVVDAVCRFEPSVA